MLSLPLRIILIVGSIGTIAFMLWRIRAAKMQIKDTISWIILAVVLLILSLFPQLALWASRVFDIASPINFVYLVIIFVLVIKLFSLSLRISQLDARLQQLAQQHALNKKDQEDKAKDSGEP